MMGRSRPSFQMFDVDQRGFTASCLRCQSVHNKLRSMAGYLDRKLMRLATMAIVAIGLVFAPFAAAHAERCADHSASLHSLVQDHPAAMAGHGHRHSEDSHPPAGTCCVSTCLICATPFDSGASEFLHLSHPVVYGVEVAPLTGHPVPPGLDPPRKTV